MSVKEMVTGFRAFVLRGNLLDLAVAVVIGIAFGNVINSIVTNLLTPIIALIVGENSLRSLDFEIGDAIFFYGAVLDDLITFVAICAALYFFVVLPAETMTRRMRAGEPTPDATTKLCPECLSEIPVAARRCAPLRPTRCLSQKASSQRTTWPPLLTRRGGLGVRLPLAPTITSAKSRSPRAAPPNPSPDPSRPTHKLPMAAGLVGA